MNWKVLHGLPIEGVTRREVAAGVRAIAEHNGPVTANRARASLSTFFRWAIGEGLCEQNPVAGTNKQEEKGPRDRTLTDAEVAAILEACPDNNYGRVLRLLFFTGCRREEIGSLCWSEVDLETKTITLPGTRTKNHAEHVVPLCDAALAILKDVPRLEDRDYVFGVRGKLCGFNGWSESKGKLDEVCKVKDWTVHDIRRTVRTGLGRLGIIPHVAEAVLNHLPAKLIRTYDRNKYETEKRAALDAWANHLAVIVAQASGTNVTRLPTNKTA
jgi:integrase